MPIGVENWATLAMIVAGAFVGGFVNGLTGFGTALSGLPLWLQAVEPLIAAQLASACSVVGHAASIRHVWHAADWRRLAPMLVAGLIGVPIGTMILPLIPLNAFKMTVGVVLIVYCSFMLFAAGRVRMAAGGSVAEAVVGFAGGILGGIAALSGTLPTIYASLKGWPKDQRRVFFQAFNFTLLTVMLLASLVQGLIGVKFLISLAVAVPGTLLGSQIGVRAYRRLDDRRFDRVVLFVLLLSGIGLVWFSR
jgi:uncharacterized membrane protein YfcA